VLIAMVSEGAFRWIAAEVRRLRRELDGLQVQKLCHVSKVSAVQELSGTPQEEFVDKAVERKGGIPQFRCVDEVADVSVQKQVQVVELDLLVPAKVQEISGAPQKEFGDKIVQKQVPAQVQDPTDMKVQYKGFDEQDFGEFPGGDYDEGLAEQDSDYRQTVGKIPDEDYEEDESFDEQEEFDEYELDLMNNNQSYQEYLLELDQMSARGELTGEEDEGFDGQGSGELPDGDYDEGMAVQDGDYCQTVGKIPDEDYEEDESFDEQEEFDEYELDLMNNNQSYQEYLMKLDQMSARGEQDCDYRQTVGKIPDEDYEEDESFDEQEEFDEYELDLMNNNQSYQEYLLELDQMSARGELTGEDGYLEYLLEHEQMAARGELTDKRDAMDEYENKLLNNNQSFQEYLLEPD